MYNAANDGYLIKHISGYGLIMLFYAKLMVLGFTDLDHIPGTSGCVMTS